MDKPMLPWIGVGIAVATGVIAATMLVPNVPRVEECARITTSQLGIYGAKVVDCHQASGDWMLATVVIDNPTPAQLAVLRHRFADLDAILASGGCKRQAKGEYEVCYDRGKHHLSIARLK